MINDGDCTSAWWGGGSGVRVWCGGVAGVARSDDMQSFSVDEMGSPAVKALVLLGHIVINMRAGRPGRLRVSFHRPGRARFTKYLTIYRKIIVSLS